jgi:hypothetical protein
MATASRSVPERLRGAVQGALMAAGAIDIEVVVLFLAWAGDRIYIDRETNQPAGLDLVDEYKREKPNLFKANVHRAGDVVPVNAKTWVVNIPELVSIPVGIIHYRFVPNAKITDPHIVALAKEHGIALREQ